MSDITEPVPLAAGYSAKRSKHGTAILHVNGGLHMASLCEEALIGEIDRLRAQVAEMREDAERLNWLATQYVVVRTPLRYGSRESFSGSPWDVEDSSPWDIRAAIDRARKSGPEGAA